MSSTEASVTQPLSTVNVMTSVLVMNGMTTLMSSLVTGSKIIFTSFFTTCFGDLLRHDQAEHLDEQLDELRLAVLGRKVHHRSRVADYGK